MSADAAGGDDASDRPDYLASLKLLRRHGHGAWGTLAGAVALATCSVALELVPVWVVFRLVSSVIAGTADLRSFALDAGIAAAAFLASFAALAGAYYLSHLTAFNLIYSLRLTIARHLATLSLGYFSQRQSGDAKKLVVDEPERLELLIAHGIPEGISALAAWLAVSVWLFAVDWRMAIAAVVLTPISFALLTAAVRSASAQALAAHRAALRMNAAIVEFLGGIAVVKIFNRADRSVAETGRAVRNCMNAETALARRYVPLGGTFYALVLANIVVIVPVGAWLLLAGEIDLATLAFFIILGSNYSQPLLKLFNQFHNLAHLSMGSRLVADALAEPSQPDTGRIFELSSHDVAFENVRFAYGERPVLHEVQFVARPRTLIALIGPSGAGKSTIAGLIPRFRDVQQGRISIDGVDVRDMGLAQLMDTVAFVFQDTFLFADTIAANIRFGNSDASDEEVEAAARAARAHDFIVALPDRYDTRLGDQGRSLSGGERQRIAIARAILKDAPVVVLDEATAFADPDSEVAIQEAIGALAEGKTLILVAHRLNTVVSADLILVVDAGRIVERGRHDDLIALGGLYSRLWADYMHAQSTALHSTTGATLSEAVG